MGDEGDHEIEFRGNAGLEAVLAHGRRLLGTSPKAAAAQAREILRLNPEQGDAHRLLAKALRLLGRTQEAEQAELDAIAASAHVPTLVDAAIAIREDRLRDAEQLLRHHLADTPEDAAALRMLAEIAVRAGALADAEGLLGRTLELAPAFTSARLRLARVLLMRGRFSQAVEVLDRLLSRDPANLAAADSKAAILSRAGDYHDAIATYERLIDQCPGDTGIWLSYGHVLNTVGRLPESIAAYRRALALDPTLGEAWWSVANLKTVRMGERDIATMRAALDDEDLDQDRRLHLHFALGKAYEDAASWEPSFQHYSAGNAIRHAALNYEPEALGELVRLNREMYTPAFFADRQGFGCDAPDPIFIVGTPRAGSTLIEQILSSHSMVEGTSELPHLPDLARGIEEEHGAKDDAPYPAPIADLDARTLQALGEEYLERARIHRKTDKPFFIDKLPNNWLNIGLIQLILPNAKIIDARRHPLDACFSNFKQNFASGQIFSYSLDDLGRYYADYVRLLAHFDEVLPGRVHRVIHEAIVDETEAEVRRLLDYVGLPFEEACLKFYQNDRAVRTPSAEQVRRPINREGIGRWRPYEPWLGPLKAALGPILDCYPQVPEGSA
jgi:tetratricopeptide (TPR) repeat protein